MDFVSGNCRKDDAGERGWFVGHFFGDGGDLRFTTDVEVKWATHPAGDTRPAWSRNRTATTISILISGRFRVSFAGGDVVLCEQGDYVLWAAGVPHHWVAEEESTIVTVRWPSLAGDSQSVPAPR
ncbi:MAG TPA: signal peptidase I [Candidatus Binatia bacterium]|nr:signal peptidase I [Candidatus Binatia bacterium]